MRSAHCAAQLRNAALSAPLARLVPVRNVDGDEEEEHAENKVDHGAHACGLARSSTRRYIRLVPAARAGGTSITRIVESALPLTRFRELGEKARQVGCLLYTSDAADE